MRKDQDERWRFLGVRNVPWSTNIDLNWGILHILTVVLNCTEWHHKTQNCTNEPTPNTKKKRTNFHLHLSPPNNNLNVGINTLTRTCGTANIGICHVDIDNCGFDWQICIPRPWTSEWKCRSHKRGVAYSVRANVHNQKNGNNLWHRVQSKEHSWVLSFIWWSGGHSRWYGHRSHQWRWYYYDLPMPWSGICSWTVCWTNSCGTVWKSKRCDGW